MKKSNVVLLAVFCLALGLFGGTVLTKRAEPLTGAVSPTRSVIVTFPYQGKRVVQALTVSKESRCGTKPVEYVPSDPDTDWWIEKDGVVYLCAPVTAP